MLIDVDKGVHEAISNAIEVLEEMLGWKNHRKHSSEKEKSVSRFHSKNSFSIIRLERCC